MFNLYAVMGNPIAHSRSPWLHSTFASLVNQDITYESLLVSEGDFELAIHDFFKRKGAHGLSVTLPFKEQAYQKAVHKTQRAQKAGSVNTLWIDEEQQLHGDNTDGVGLIRDLMLNHRFNLSDKRILVIGAGGAVKGVLSPLLEQKPKSLMLVNRTYSKAEKLVQSINHPLLSCCHFEDLVEPFDLIINGTSASLAGQVLPLPKHIVKQYTICYDMMYSNQTTLFHEWSRQNGCLNNYDGLGMLVEQAAEQFFIWRGVRPITSQVFNLL